MCNCAGNKTADRSFESVKIIAESFARIEMCNVVMYHSTDGWCYDKEGTQPSGVLVTYTIVVK